MRAESDVPLTLTPSRTDRGCPRPLVLTLALLAAGAASAASMPPVAEVHKALREIEGAVLRGKVDVLRLKYQEQARNRPGDVALRVYLAWCAMPSDESWNAFKAIASIHPEEPWVHQGMGRIYLAWKMRDQASNELNAALKSNRRFYPALVALGDAARAGGDLDAAEARYREALAVQDDAEARSGLGLVMLERGKVEEAGGELTRAVELWGDQPQARSALAKLSREGGDAKKAAEHLTRLVELSPKDRDARRTLADLRFELGEKEAAAQEYERFLRLGAVEAGVLIRLGSIYRELSRADDEERAVQQLSELDKSNPEHPLRLSELAEARGAFEEAQGELLEAADRAPSRSDIQLRLARSRESRGQLREALEAYRAAAASGGDAGTEAADGAKELVAQFKLPKPAKGSVEKVYAAISKSLYALYTERLKERPGLGGLLKLRVKVGADGRAVAVESVEDTLDDPIIAAHVYFALKDAEYPKQKRDPVFEFDLKPPATGGK
ncbi:MAG: tetratricopeptide repeat protein [Myxococcales bacterium]|nr:tetratricopeptide repeat protein [Myxococcales bacterium]